MDQTLEQSKMYLRSVLLSSKGDVEAQQVSKDYHNLVGEVSRKHLINIVNMITFLKVSLGYSLESVRSLQPRNVPPVHSGRLPYLLGGTGAEGGRRGEPAD